MADQQGIAANAMPAGYGTYTAVPVEEKGIGDVLHSAGSYAKKEFHKAKDLLTRGNFTTWGLAIIASLMTMFASFWLFWINFFTMSPIQGMLQVYFIAFSILVLVLEMNPKYLPKVWVHWLAEYMKFLSLLKGRGFFYIFFATLLFGEWHLFHAIAGGLFAFTGLVMIWMGHRAGKKLRRARSQFKDEAFVKQKFFEADSRKQGFLTPAELATLCQNLGTTLTRSELEAAIAILDKNRDQQISFAEFFEWWAK